MIDNQTQPIKFAELARALECDEDEGRWENRLRALAKCEPLQKPETPVA